MGGKYASYIGILFISLGVAGLIVSLVTNRWATLKVSVSGKNIAESLPADAFNKGSTNSGMFGTMTPMTFNIETLKKMSMDMEIHYGLKQMCSGHSRISPELLKTEKFKELEQRLIPGLCFDIDIYDRYEAVMDEDTIQSPPWRMYKKIVKGLHNTMICIAIASALGIIGLILSFVKVPAWYTKNATVLVSITIAVCGLAALTSMIGIIIFHKEVQIKKDIDDMIQKYTAGSVGSSYAKIMEKVFELKEKFGYSCYMAYVGAGCLFLAVLMNILELVCKRNPSRDDYKMELVQNGEFA